MVRHALTWVTCAALTLLTANIARAAQLPAAVLGQTAGVLLLAERCHVEVPASFKALADSMIPKLEALAATTPLEFGSFIEEAMLEVSPDTCPDLVHSLPAQFETAAVELHAYDFLPSPAQSATPERIAAQQLMGRMVALAVASSKCAYVHSPDIHVLLDTAGPKVQAAAGVSDAETASARQLIDGQIDLKDCGTINKALPVDFETLTPAMRRFL